MSLAMRFLLYVSFPLGQLLIELTFLRSGRIIFAHSSTPTFHGGYLSSFSVSSALF